MKILFALLLLLLVQPSSSETKGQKLCAFFPENDLKVSVSASQNNMTPSEFYQALEKVERSYSREFTRKGLVLSLQKLWNSPAVNAYSRRNENIAVIEIHGGLARLPRMTVDGITLITCHEMGHHLGGPPRKIGENRDWFSAEGQADYFATLKCLRLAWKGEPIEALEAPALVIERCQAAFSNDPQTTAICIRAALAGLSAAQVFKDVFNEPSEPLFETPDPRVVASPLLEYPSTQCRLDTYFQGALCTVPVTEKIDERIPYKGMCLKRRGYAEGYRPFCWFNE